MPANNYVKLSVHLDANEGDDGLALGFARKCKKLAEVAPEKQYRNCGSFSWVIPFTGDGSGKLPADIETKFGAVRAELTTIISANEIRESVWRSRDAQGLDVIGKFYDT